MHNDLEKVILVDCDGVLLNWEYAFDVWVQGHGYKRLPNTQFDYDVSYRYGLERPETKRLIKMFNESAAIGFLPPLRDAIHYVKKLHEEHGYVFRAITSLSLDPHAGELRKRNLEKLFGETTFEQVVCLDCGADKDEALAPYKDSGLLWVEDKLENAVVGRDLGLDAILLEHGHNMNNEEGILTMPSWKNVYNYIVGA